MKTNVLQKSIIWVLLFCLAFSLGIVLAGPAGAEELKTDVMDSYTTPYEDLIEKEIPIGGFPEAGNTTPLEFKAIAEGANGELFVYAYSSNTAEPCIATEIRLSQTLGDDLAPKDYKLTRVSEWSTLFKYKVEGITVSIDYERYYYVIQLTRPYNSMIDAGSEYDDTVTAVPVPVSMLYTFKGFDDEISCLPSKMTEIVVTDKDVDFIRYYDGWSLGPPFGDDTHSYDSYYIVFNTDLLIENLLEADVEYYTVYSEKKYFAGVSEDTLIEVEREDPPTGPHYKTLKSNEVVSNGLQGWFAPKQTWTEIQSVSEFLTSEKEYLKDEAKEKIKNFSWVLRFFGSLNKEVILDSTAGIGRFCSTAVSDSTILRLQFVTHGEPYNLAVIDNKQTDDGIPDGEAFPDAEVLSAIEELWEKIKYILLIVFVVIVLGFISAFCPWIFTFIWAGIKFIFKAIWWVISFPFNLIGKKKRKRKKKNE